MPAKPCPITSAHADVPYAEGSRTTTMPFAIMRDGMSCQMYRLTKPRPDWRQNAATLASCLQVPPPAAPGTHAEGISFCSHGVSISADGSLASPVAAPSATLPNHFGRGGCEAYARLLRAHPCRGLPPPLRPPVIARSWSRSRYETVSVASHGTIARDWFSRYCGCRAPDARLWECKWERSCNTRRESV